MDQFFGYSVVNTGREGPVKMEPVFYTRRADVFIQVIFFKMPAAGGAKRRQINLYL
jgi:hypothetical protein